ncbi:MAG: hypothetical protein ACRD72_00210 [Candidatus Angelobacter sp.]
MKKLSLVLAGSFCCSLISLLLLAQSATKAIPFEVNRYVSGGDGSDANPWVSQSGCGGLLEAFDKLPERGGILHLRTGTYKITKPCKLTGKSFSIKGDGLDKVTIDASALPLNATALTIEGTLKPLTLTRDAIHAGTTAFSVQVPNGISTGDWLLIRSKTELWNKFRPYYLKGEWQQVKTVSGNTVTPGLKMWDSYNPGTDVGQLVPITVDISGFTMNGNPDPQNGMQCFLLQYAVDSSIHNTATKDCNESGWGLEYTVNSSFHHNAGIEHYPDKPQGLNYGLVVAMSYNLEAYENNISSGRHAIAVGAGGGGGVDREIKVHNNVLAGANNMALDAHGIAEYFYYENNQITGGADFGGQHGFFRGNTVSGGSKGQYLLVFGEVKSWNFEIQNNTFIVGPNQSSAYAPIVQISHSQDAQGNFIFQKNHLKVASSAPITTPQAVYLTFPSGDSVDELDFSGNEFTSDVPVATSSTDAYTIRIVGKIGKLVFSNNQLKGFSAFLSGMDQADVELNTVDHAPSYGIRVVAGHEVKLIRNTVSFSNKTGLQVDTPATPATVTVEGNIAYNNGQDTTQRDIDRSGFSKNGPGGATVLLNNNSFYDNLPSHTQQIGAFVYATEGADSVRDIKNTYSGNAVKPFEADARTKAKWQSQR